jgi:hypothetical protein
MQQLHTLLRAYADDRGPVLGWNKNNPLWLTSFLTVENDPNLQKYLGEHQLDHFRDQILYTNDVKGFYELDVAHGHLHIGKLSGNSMVHKHARKVINTEGINLATLDIAVIAGSGPKSYGVKFSESKSGFTGCTVRKDQIDYLLSLDQELKFYDTEFSYLKFEGKTIKGHIATLYGLKK